MLEELNDAQKARVSIREFKTTTDALILRGYYKPQGAMGQTLEHALRTISPEIYGSMNDSQRVELDGLVYVIDRLPIGIEECNQTTLSAAEGLDHGFKRIIPLKRRRTSYRVNDREMCFEITKGRSEIYDLVTHLTFLNVEAKKIKHRGYHESEKTQEWIELEEMVLEKRPRQSLDREIWNLSKVLGRSFDETKKAYEKLEANANTANSGLFKIVYWLGRRVAEADQSKDLEHLTLFTTSLIEMIGHHKYGEIWATAIKKSLNDLGLHERPIHIISSNLHSVLNLLYGYPIATERQDIYDMVKSLRDRENLVLEHAKNHGLYYLADQSGTYIDCQIIDTARLDFDNLHPQVLSDRSYVLKEKPVILVIDYAFGEQAFEVMDELLKPYLQWHMPVKSLSIMGKAGILEGDKGDLMLADAHIFEGTTDTYLCQNQLHKEDFDATVNVYRGPMVTVLGTSLQNKKMLNYFMESSWKAVGLEMEGGHYQKAIQAAIIRKHISSNVTLRYAYYASDNPVKTGLTLASGSMGEGGIKPTYMITNIFLQKILNAQGSELNTRVFPRNDVEESSISVNDKKGKRK